MEPNPILCLQDTYTHGKKKKKNTDIVMINTKFGILLTSEEEGGWDQGNIKGASSGICYHFISSLHVTVWACVSLVFHTSKIFQNILIKIGNDNQLFLYLI